MSIAVESDSPASRAWRGPHPSARVAGTHKIVGVIYLVFAVMFTLAMMFGRQGGLEVGMVVAAVAFFVFAAIHLGLSRGATRNLKWVRGVSIVAALPLLFAFPIGTFLGVVIIINSAKSWD